MRRNLIRLAGAACLLAGPWAGAAFAAPAATVHVLQASMRAPRPGFASTALDVTLSASLAARVVGARLQDAAGVEMRSMRRNGAEVTAVPVPAIDLPPGEPVRLQIGPGSSHLIALRLNGSPQPGQHRKLWLEVEDVRTGRRSTIATPVLVLPARGVHADDEH